MEEGQRRPPRNRPDHDGKHRQQFDRNKKIIYASQSVCAICGRPVDFTKKSPDPMSPSIDHIIPISRGGHPSALENMQLAHLNCNRKKGNSINNNKFDSEMESQAHLSNRNLILSADWKTF